MLLLALAGCGAWALLTSHQWDIDDATNVLESAGHVVTPAPPEDVDRLRGLDGYLSTDCVSIEDGTVYCLHTFGDNHQATKAAPALPPSIEGAVLGPAIAQIHGPSAPEVATITLQANGFRVTARDFEQ